MKVETRQIEKIREYLENYANVAAVYLFGSAALRKGAVNDLDLLILERHKEDRLKLQWDLVHDLSKLSGFPPDKIDIVFFDREAVDPDVLKNAVNSGILLKSCKYSTIVIAEAMAGVLQHILAKKHNVVVGGYKEVFDKSMAHRLVAKDLLERLQPFISFRNMLVHQYWRVKDDVFLQNLR